MWGLIPLQGGFEPPVQRFGHPAAIGRPYGRYEHIVRHRYALSYYMLSPLPPVRSGAPSSLRSSAALGVRRPAGGAGGGSNAHGRPYSPLRPVGSPYGRPSLWARQHPWRRGRTGRPHPTHPVRATYPSVIPNDCRPNNPAADRPHPTNCTCSGAFLGTYMPTSPVLAYYSSYFTIFVL